MKLQRENFYGSGVAGDWYSADDVDALLARIREAVEAERVAGNLLWNSQWRDDPDGAAATALVTQTHARAALDALLSGEG
jgi:hypothetical protein